MFVKRIVDLYREKLNFFGHAHKNMSTLLNSLNSLIIPTVIFIYSDTFDNISFYLIIKVVANIDSLWPQL